MVDSNYKYKLRPHALHGDWLDEWFVLHIPHCGCEPGGHGYFNIKYGDSSGWRSIRANRTGCSARQHNSNIVMDSAIN
jgi:hypothetical protein